MSKVGSEIHVNINRVILTKALRALARDSRIETIDKFYVKKSYFF